jgi:hypothetical protein
MALPRNRHNNKLSRDRDPNSRGGYDPRFDNTNPSDTAKQNYTAIRYGNDHGSISFGHIHKEADVTAAVLLQAPEGEHQFSLDKDGQRKGWTSSTSPGHFQVECGSASQEKEDTLMLNAKNGNIVIVATNGKIRLEADDIELVARGTSIDSGNITCTASENFVVKDTKKVIISPSISYKIVTPGTGEVVANGVLKMYGSIIRGVTDACSTKDGKYGGKRFVNQNNRI